MILLDTNVISEAMRAAPDASVVRWLSAHGPFDLATTTINVAELKFGIDRLPSGRRRADLQMRFDALINRGLLARIFAFDARAAEAFAQLAVGREQGGRPFRGFDGLIAAIAASRGLAVATRDIGGFAACGIDIINPWNATAS